MTHKVRNKNSHNPKKPDADIAPNNHRKPDADIVFIIFTSFLIADHTLYQQRYNETTTQTRKLDIYNSYAFILEPIISYHI